MKTHDRPLNIHENLKTNSIGVRYSVTGDYLYYHYLQDGKDDNGWGCAYRSMQTLLSHLLLNSSYTGVSTLKIKGKEVPNHKDIQQALVDMGDKEKDFVGSSQWIGAVEVAMCISYFTNDVIDCKIVNVTEGSLLLR